MKPKLLQAYMKTAETFAELSHARRLHVGAIMVAVFGTAYSMEKERIKRIRVGPIMVLE